MYKKTIISIALLASLTACGSSSDSDSGSDDENSVSGTTYTVIDGYLSDAKVCVIDPSDANEVCTDIGSTDENGQIVVPGEYDGYTVVANIIAGQTKDSDDVGYATTSYEMRSAEDVAVVTPFTTIAALDDSISLDDIATKLGLDVEDITEDYIASGNDKAHLVAQVLADNNDLDTEEQLDLIFNVADYIENTLIDTDLSNIKISLDNSGNPISEDVLTLSSFLEGSDVKYMASMTSSYYASEGVSNVTFLNGVYSLTNDINQTDLNGTYTIDESTDTLNIDNDGSDTFIYLSDEFGLVVTDQDDINVISPDDLSITSSFVDEDLAGKIYYYIDSDENDDGDIELFYAKLEFGNNNTVNLTYDDSGEEANSTVDYLIANGTTDADTDSNLYDAGTLVFKDMPFKKVLNNDDMMVVFATEGNTERLALFISNESLAKTIFDKWEDSADRVDSADEAEETKITNFSTEWLDGRTLYSVYPDLLGANSWGLSTFTYTASEISAKTLGHEDDPLYSLDTTYEINDDGNMTWVSDNIAVELHIQSSEDEYLDTCYVISGECVSDSEIMFYDLETAQEYISNQ